MHAHRFAHILLMLALCFSLITFGCSKKTSDSSNSDNSSGAAPATTANNTDSDKNSPDAARERHEREKEKEEAAKRPPVTVPSGTAITVSLGSSLGSKLSQSGQTFTGSVAKAVMVGDTVAIPQGSAVSGTVTGAKPLGRFAGGAELDLRIDSINVRGADKQVQASQVFSAKGKGKRTAVLAGGGAALGGIIGGIAGGGKGAAIGLLAGGGAGGGGAALTGNKDIVLPAESAVSFELAQPVEVRP